MYIPIVKHTTREINIQSTINSFGSLSREQRNRGTPEQPQR